jgi:hypothetical protein
MPMRKTTSSSQHPLNHGLRAMRPSRRIAHFLLIGHAVTASGLRRGLALPSIWTCSTSGSFTPTAGIPELRLLQTQKNIR